MAITRHGRYTVTVNGVQHGAQHNDYAEAVQHAVEQIQLNPTFVVLIVPPEYWEVSFFPTVTGIPAPEPEPPAPTPTPEPPAPIPEPPTPPPAPSDDVFLNTLLNFAETWSQNWNFEGHEMDQRFFDPANNGYPGSTFGYWIIDDGNAEEWLFDRASVAYMLFKDTGDVRWWNQFLTYFEFYRNHIDAQGIFTEKANNDTKYSYVAPFLYYERETGDAQYRPIAKRIYDTWIREFPDNYSPNVGLWTEREIGFALEAAIDYYRLTGEAAALDRARAMLNNWDQACGTNSVPLHTLSQHAEDDTPEWADRMMTSPWMAGIYFQAATKLARIDVASVAQVTSQLRRYANWIDQFALYDGSIVHPEIAGFTLPYYLLGEDGVYTRETPGWGDMNHCYDVGLIMQAAIDTYESAPANLVARRDQLMTAAAEDLRLWTRTTTWLPKYRVDPPRKFNWMYRARILTINY